MPRAATVVSRDGTPLATYEMGEGDGVVLVHGAMQAAASFTKLAAALAAAGFRVVRYDRRGRGGSGPAGDDALACEAQDLGAVLEASGARSVFGLSSGAIIAMHAALDGA